MTESLLNGLQGDIMVKASWPGRQDFTEGELPRLFALMEEEGITRAVFFDGPISALDFQSFALSDDNHFAVVYEKTHGLPAKPLGLFWLNRHSGLAAMLHFAVFKRALPFKEYLGRLVLGWCFGGGLATLVSLTPSHNLGAIDFALVLGGKIVGRLKKALYSHRFQKAVDGTLLMFENPGKTSPRVESEATTENQGKEI